MPEGAEIDNEMLDTGFVPLYIYISCKSHYHAYSSVDIIDIKCCLHYGTAALMVRASAHAYFKFEIMS